MAVVNYIGAVLANRGENLRNLRYQTALQMRVEAMFMCRRAYLSDCCTLSVYVLLFAPSQCVAAVRGVPSMAVT